MSMSGKSRRSFLLESATGLGAAWVTSNYSGILAAEAFVMEAAQSGQPTTFAFFTPEQAVEIDAMTAQIIPTDDTPGAREARVVSFIDRALVTFDSDRQGDYTQGLGDLLEETTRLFPDAASFSSLTYDQQLSVLTAVEETPFFNLVRTHTITGFFAHPVHGGNHDKIGWQLVNYDDSLDHQPPFGYYDARPQPRR
jgi:gluconate 2-dehydrogenase gamma chain